MLLNKKRHLSSQEEKLLEELILRAKMNIPPNWRENLLVSSLNDGGMGSLALHPSGINSKKRCFGYQASDCQFRDIDGVMVIASLYLDKEGQLYELDIWKTDFSPLKEISANFQDV